MTDKTRSELFKKCIGYEVNKKNWTRSQHQEALFARAMESFPELYEISHPDYNDLDKVETSWKKLAVLRKRIYGADEAELKTTTELKGICLDMASRFLKAFVEICSISVPLPDFLLVKELLEMADELMPIFSHMLFTIPDEAFAGILMLRLPDLKIIRGFMGWVVVYPDGRAQLLKNVVPRVGSAKIVQDFYEEFLRRVKPACECVKLYYESKDDSA